MASIARGCPTMVSSGSSEAVDLNFNLDTGHFQRNFDILTLFSDTGPGFNNFCDAFFLAAVLLIDIA